MPVASIAAVLDAAQTCSQFRDYLITHSYYCFFFLCMAVLAAVRLRLKAAPVMTVAGLLLWCRSLPVLVSILTSPTVHLCYESSMRMYYMVVVDLVVLHLFFFFPLFFCFAEPVWHSIRSSINQFRDNTMVRIMFSIATTL